MRYVFVILTIFACPFLASAATLKVPSQYSTIQDATNAASGGDTVKVAPGTYVEIINFKGKAITVKSTGGAGMTVIDGNYAGSVVTFSKDEADIACGFIEEALK